MKKILWFLIFSLGIFANNFTEEKTEISFSIKKVNSLYEISVTAPTTEGWVAIGFGGGMAMKDSEMIMLYNTNGKGELEHHYGTSTISHKKIKDLMSGYNDENLSLKSFSTANGKTTYVFERSEKEKNDYIKKFEKGKTIKVILAYGSSMNTSKKHKKAGSIEIILP